MCEKLTLGSLFSGIGGFELAAKEAGIVTKWNCEIECYPRLVLKSRFPNVTQYGDIHKLNGAEATPVDIITFGSPCQSFSQAGQRARLDGASDLFYEAVRIIKEMRKATNGEFPKYAVMENVPGIYSSKSQKKSDFREVLNELLKICDKGESRPQAVYVPEPKNGRFLTAGAVLGNGYSLAWRTLCASKFGVAQRRRRMFLVVSFTDERAAEILSEQEGERRNFTPSYFARQGSAGSAEASVGSVVAFEAGALKRIDKNAWTDRVRTLRADMGDNQTAVAYAAPLDLRNAVRNGGEQGTGIGENGEPSFTITSEYTHGVAVENHIIANHANDSRYKLCEKYAPCVNARSGLGGGNVDLCVEVKSADDRRPIMLDERKHAAPITEDYVSSLTATDYKGTTVYFEPQTMKVRCGCEGGGKGALIQKDKSGTLSCNNDQTLFEPAAIALQGNLIGRADVNGPCGKGYKEEQSYTINTVDKGGAVCYCEQVSALTTELAHGTGSQGQVGGQLVVEKEAACYQETVGALCASDWRGIRNQDIGDDKAIVETETFGNSGFGKWRENDSAGQTIKSSGGDFQGSENVVVEKSYAVRRLTPLECLRLQGFPDYWLSDIHIAEPTAEQIEYWRSAWAELGKKKSDNQLKKWLADPYGDSPAYKAIGNSLCVPIALFVLRGIAENSKNITCNV